GPDVPVCLIRPVGLHISAALVHRRVLQGDGDAALAVVLGAGDTVDADGVEHPGRLGAALPPAGDRPDAHDRATVIPTALPNRRRSIARVPAGISIAEVVAYCPCSNPTR